MIAAIKDPRMRKKVLSDASSSTALYKALQELAINLVNRNIPLTQSQKTRLRKKKSVIMGLTRSPKSLKRRKQLVVQTGGFLPLLLATAAPVLTEIARSAANW